MLLDLDKEDLKALVKGRYPYYSAFENPLVKKAGHSYNHQNGTTNWDSLDSLSEMELIKLYKICKNSWP